MKFLDVIKLTVTFLEVCLQFYEIFVSIWALYTCFFSLEYKFFLFLNIQIMPQRIDTPGASEDNQTVDGLQMPLVANGPPLQLEVLTAAAIHQLIFVQQVCK